MYRDVMLVATGTDRDEAVLQGAAEFCRAIDARLSVSVPFDLPEARLARYGTTPVILEASLDQLRDQAREQVASIRAQLHAMGVRFDVHIAEAQVGPSKALLALEALHSDLVLLPLPGTAGIGTSFATIHTLFAALVADSGRPVLALPPGRHLDRLPERVVVGWLPTPEASRAVHDAMPLLKAARRVTVVLADPLIGEWGSGQEPGADIAGHLARHGVSVDVEVHRPSRGPAGNDLLLSVAEQGAELLVAGAYGHSRAREWAFGGVTRDLLERAGIPVLFSH